MSEADRVFDVVIVGAGVAGALVAWKLLDARGRDEVSVLLLDAGENVPEVMAPQDRMHLVQAYVTAANKTMGAPYKGRDGDRLAPSPDTPHDYYDQAKDKDEFKATYQRRVGGSTWHWRGNIPRMIPNDFRMKSVYGVGVDWPVTYDELEPWFCEAEWEVGVSGDHAEWDGFLGAYRSRPYPMSKIWPCYGDTVVAEALDGVTFNGTPIRVLSTPQARNSQPYDNRPPCAGNSTCDPICPIQAKYDATVHVRKAVAAGAVLRDKSVATYLHVDEDQRVRRVTYRTWDGGEHTVTGRVVVLAAHAIETPKLLLMSTPERAPGGQAGPAQPPRGVANQSDQVGRNLMDHLQGQAAAIVPEPLFPFRGPPTTSGVDSFRDGDFRRTHSAFRMSLGNDGWGLVEGPYATLRNLVFEEKLFGARLKERLADRITRQFRLSYSTETLPNPNNRVTVSEQVDGLRVPRPKIDFELDEYNKRAFEVGRQVIRTIFQALKVTEMKFNADPNAYSSANHIMGTCRMGADARTSVVDAQCRAHDHPNLFILGASVFPTSGTANPTLAVVALALRAVGAIRSQLQAERGR